MDSKIKTQVKVDGEMLSLPNAKQHIELDLAIRIIKQIPHEDLVKLFNIQWYNEHSIYNSRDKVAVAEINYKKPAQIEGLKTNYPSEYSEEDYV